MTLVDSLMANRRLSCRPEVIAPNATGRRRTSNKGADDHPSNQTGRCFSMAKDESQTLRVGYSKSRVLRRLLGAYLFQSRRIWNHLPPLLRLLSPGWLYGRHLHALVRRHAERSQSFATFFLRNRAELELMRRLVNQKGHGSNLDISVVACSKGAEVYSILWTIRSARPDLRFRTHAVDISQDILEFAARGVYSRNGLPALNATSEDGKAKGGDVTWKDQPVSIFERMADEEMEAVFELEGDQARVRPWLKEGITWRRGDAADPALGDVLGPQDIVVANRFLCHMEPAAADKCLRNIARLVKPGGYLFVSGIDLDVRAKVARELGWKPVIDLMREIHEGDASLAAGWPLEYWGLEPFRNDRPDWRTRYASVFQIGETADSGSRDGAPKSMGPLDHMGYCHQGGAVEQTAIVDIKTRVVNTQLLGFSK
jgi:chemotaxis methyl-accepting protein methylase